MRSDAHPPAVVSSSTFEEMSQAAWDIRENALVFGPTKVGCAALSESGKIYSGCNVEHRFRSHDVHSEVNAITTMIASGERKLVAILIAAERDRFTPCGACMDWIMQCGGGDCIVAFQPTRNAELQIHTARELMPHYPE